MLAQLDRPRLACSLETIFPKRCLLKQGLATRTVEGVKVSVTTPAKTVADCFRYRSHVGLDVALAAFRDCLRKHRSGIDALVVSANADRIYSLMRPYLEALA